MISTRNQALLGVTLLVLIDFAKGVSVTQKIKDDPDLSHFYALLDRSELANVTLQYKQVTIFAPINAAFQKFPKNIDEPNELVLYHMTSVPKRTDQLGTSSTSLYSELEGSPPLWITHISGVYHDSIFINNARILISQSNIQGIQRSGNEQVLHKIDGVLEPTRSPKTASNRLYNPTAFEFLEHYESLIMDPHRVRSFRQKVQQHNKQDIFKTEGGHTFFIPVDEGFKNDRANKIDGKVIDGHVIPRQVLFTTPTKKDVSFQTLANGDNNIRVLISFTEETRGQNQVVNYVKSHTLFGDGVHTQGVVLAEIVKANIPVKNGVIHLIQKPLMVVDNNVRDLLKDNNQDIGILSKFVEAISISGLAGEDFYKTIERSHDVTLFAPCNAAWNNDLSLNNIIRDKARFKEILSMHLVVDKRLYVDQIIKNNQARLYQTPTLNKRKNLIFNVMTVGNNRTVTVDGGGVNATILQADLAATNGVIHIIDRVLGVPYTTVQDKLRTDPMLNDTYSLGQLRGFNNMLNDTTRKFTYFVPRDKAWEDARIQYPSEIKKIFMPEYSYFANDILEHHLVISDVPYTMERIKLASNITNTYGTFGARREVELPTLRGGSLKLFVEERVDHSFIIHWKGEKIPVFRPNVECTNGIIHVLDAPFLQEGDIRVNSATKWFVAPHIVMVLAAKWLLL